MFSLGPYCYPSKTYLKARIRSFLWNTPERDIAHPQMVDKLRYLLLMHPEREEKIGPGVRGFRVRRNVMGSGKSFVVVRSDGSEVRFSYKACLDGRLVTCRSMAVEALRLGVRYQITEFRKTLVLPVTCALSGRPIVEGLSLNIDHRYPFSDLVRDFCREADVVLSALETTGSGECLRIRSTEVERLFKDYHQLHAVLQPTLREANFLKNLLATGPRQKWSRQRSHVAAKDVPG